MAAVCPSSNRAALLCADGGESGVQKSTTTPKLSLQRSIAHSLLSHAQFDGALAVLEHGVSSTSADLQVAAHLSALGTVQLVGAMASARTDHRWAAQRYLSAADAAARRLGRDANHLWTVFGPTNVAIHRAATAAELHDFQLTADLGPKVDVSHMPTERQVRFEVARALHHRARRRSTSASARGRVPRTGAGTAPLPHPRTCPGVAALQARTTRHQLSDLAPLPHPAARLR